MIDLPTIQLNEVLYRERLQATAETRQRRATWIAGPSLVPRLRQALGSQLVALGQRIQGPTALVNIAR